MRQQIEHFCHFTGYSCRNSQRASESGGSCRSLESLMGNHDGQLSMVGSQSVVAYPDVNSSRSARTIGRLKLALVVVCFALLVMTVFFVWQITRKSAVSDQVRYKTLQSIQN